MPFVTHLFIKERYGAEQHSVNSFDANTHGIKGNVPCATLRQILILNTETLSKFGVQPGALRENAIVNDDELHDYPSGSVVVLGTIRIRLTFHCEPCAKIRGIADPKAILHSRGYLGTVLNMGCVARGDKFANHGQLFPPIPYRTIDRVKWFLDTYPSPVSASHLVEGIGLAKGFCRAVPGYLKQLGPEYARMVYFSKNRAA
ncbi:MAG: MOSC domain-containing protein [Planctomycetes bacterium]|nr:MOSC domain-containing protein [Planctomycetota bacterium]